MPQQINTDKNMIDKEYGSKLLQFYPQEYNARKQMLRKAGELISDQMDLEFEVGNHYKMLTESEVEVNNLGLINLHRWTAFIKIGDAKRSSSLSKIV